MSPRRRTVAALVGGLLLAHSLLGQASEIERYQVGDLLLVLPVHSCMAANAMKRYLNLDGQWVERFKV